MIKIMIKKKTLSDLSKDGINVDFDSKDDNSFKIFTKIFT